MHAMEAERQFALQESIRQELEGQCTQDDKIGQLQDDVLYHTNALTEQIIAEFENLDHRSDDDDDCIDEEPMCIIAIGGPSLRSHLKMIQIPLMMPLIFVIISWIAMILTWRGRN